MRFLLAAILAMAATPVLADQQAAPDPVSAAYRQLLDEANTRAVQNSAQAVALATRLQQVTVDNAALTKKLKAADDEIAKLKGAMPKAGAPAPTQIGPEK
jgi:hypothetical protein